MKKTILTVLLLCLLVVTYRLYTKVSVSSCHTVLNYEDFGPAVMSSSLLGQAWWQWYPTYEDPNVTFDIKVVVYAKNQSLETIEKQYPVIKDEKQDYRHVSLEDVRSYIEKLEIDNKEYFEGCRKAVNPSCDELDFIESLLTSLKPLKANHCSEK